MIEFLFLVLLILVFIKYVYFKQQVYDYIIIGAGISGTYLGHLFKKRGITNYCILEQNDCIGGRLTSIPLPDTNDYKMESGAVRFFRQNDERLWSLVQRYQIPYIEKDVNFVNATYYLRGKRQNQIQAYNIDPQEQIPNGTVQDYIQKFENQLPISLANTDTIKDTNLYSNQSLCSYSIQNISHGLYSFFVDAIGYSLFWFPLNLNSALQTLRSVLETKQLLLRDGFQNLCVFFARGSTVFLNTSVNSIKREKDGTFTLNTCQNTTRKEYHTKKIVFTGTITQVLRIQYQGLLDLLNTLHLAREQYFSYQAQRIYIQVEKPWWNENDFGRNITDLPLLQVWYYSPSVLMIYSNMFHAQMLRELAPDTPYKKWQSASRYPVLKQLLEKWLCEMFALQSCNITRLLIKYHEDASQFCKPFHSESLTLQDFLHTLRYPVPGFYMISGDYTSNPGWVNSCIEAVEDSIDTITHV